MSIDGWMVFGIGFLLGLRHAFEPDHVVAISTIASRSGSLWRASLAGVYWGIGHTFTLFVVGMLLIGVRVSLPFWLEQGMEAAVGVMLVVLGWRSVRSFRKARVHVHVHEHDGERHTHFHAHSGEQEDSSDHPHRHHHSHPTRLEKTSVWVGMIHGLAGSGALAVMTMASIHTFAQAALYILVFGAGTVLGMSTFALCLALPFVLLSKYASGLVYRLGVITGCLSMGYGVFYMYQVYHGAF